MKSPKTDSEYFHKVSVIQEGCNPPKEWVGIVDWPVALFIPEETRNDISYILDFGKSYIQLEFCCN